MSHLFILLAWSESFMEITVGRAHILNRTTYVQLRQLKNIPGWSLGCYLVYYFHIFSKLSSCSSVYALSFFFSLNLIIHFISFPIFVFPLWLFEFLPLQIISPHLWCQILQLNVLSPCSIVSLVWLMTTQSTTHSGPTTGFSISKLHFFCRGWPKFQ